MIERLALSDVARSGDTPCRFRLQVLHSVRLDGRSIAFVSRSHELAAEECLPRGATPANTRRYGVFTFQLDGALCGTQSLNASVLQQAIGAADAVDGVTQAKRGLPGGAAGTALSDAPCECDTLVRMDLYPSIPQTPQTRRIGRMTGQSC